MKLVPLVIAAALVLTGCTSAPEPVVETPVTEAPVEPVTVATGLAVSGTGIAITYDDDTTQEFAFADDPAAAIEALTLALGGPPAVSQSEQLTCQPSFDSSSWPGLGIRSNYEALPDGQKFAVTIDAAVSGSLPLSTTEGVAVGGDGSDAFKALDGATRDRATDQGVNYDTIFFDQQSGDEWGGYLFSANDTVVTIVAPVRYDTLGC